MKKVIILIDGENFRYSLKQLFPNRFKYLPKKANWSKLLTLPKSPNQELIRIYWYVPDTLRFRPFEIPENDEKLENMLIKALSKKLELVINKKTKSKYLKEKRRRFKEIKSTILKRFSEWKEAQDDISHGCDFLEFRRFGSICFNLLTNGFEEEKGVDVKLATDLLEFRNISDQAILFSGDQDYIPAIQIYKDAGKQISSVNFETKNGRILPGGSYYLEGLVDKVITLKYDQISELIKEF